MKQIRIIVVAACALACAVAWAYSPEVIKAKLIEAGVPESEITQQMLDEYSAFTEASIQNEAKWDNEMLPSIRKEYAEKKAAADKAAADRAKADAEAQARRDATNAREQYLANLDSVKVMLQNPDFSAVADLYIAKYEECKKAASFGASLKRAWNEEKDPEDFDTWLKKDRCNTFCKVGLPGVTPTMISTLTNSHPRTTPLVELEKFEPFLTAIKTKYNKKKPEVKRQVVADALLQYYQAMAAAVESYIQGYDMSQWKEKGNQFLFIDNHGNSHLFENGIFAGTTQGEYPQYFNNDLVFFTPFSTNSPRNNFSKATQEWLKSYVNVQDLYLGERDSSYYLYARDSDKQPRVEIPITPVEAYYCMVALIERHIYDDSSPYVWFCAAHGIDDQVFRKEAAIRSLAVVVDLANTADQWEGKEITLLPNAGVRKLVKSLASESNVYYNSPKYIYQTEERRQALAADKGDYAKEQKANSQEEKDKKLLARAKKHDYVGMLPTEIGRLEELGWLRLDPNRNSTGNTVYVIEKTGRKIALTLGKRSGFVVVTSWR